MQNYLPLVPTMSICKCAKPVAIDSAMASMTLVSTVFIVRKSNNEPFSWKSVTSHNCVQVPLSVQKINSNHLVKLLKNYLKNQCTNLYYQLQ